MSRPILPDQVRITIDLQDSAGRLFKVLHDSYGDIQPSAARLAAKLICQALNARFAADPELVDKLSRLDGQMFQTAIPAKPKRGAPRASK